MHGDRHSELVSPDIGDPVRQPGCVRVCQIRNGGGEVQFEGSDSVVWTGFHGTNRVVRYEQATLSFTRTVSYRTLISNQVISCQPD
jgi:hypothetical protein